MDKQRRSPVELHEQMTGSVASLVDFKAQRAMLEVAAKVHTYSLSSVLLIALPAPRRFGSRFRYIKSLGRQVRKGERGIAIFSPRSYRPRRRWR